MKTGIRLKDPVQASKLIVAAMILHNLCIRCGDEGEDLSDDDSNSEPDVENEVVDDGDEGTTEREIRVRRQNQILQFFQR